MKRRTFVKGLSAAAAAPIILGGIPVRARTPLPLLGQLSQPDNDNVLIILQLFGGNDGLNTVIPCNNDEYYRLRPGIGIESKYAWNGLGGDLYLNLAMADGNKGGMAQMLLNGSLGIVQGVGYDNPNLSHFRSTDIWLSGINSSDPNAQFNTGWMGRYLERRFPDFPLSLPPDPLAIAFGGSFSLTLLSSKGRMGIEVGDPALQSGLTSELDQLDPTSIGTRYATEYAFIADIASRSNTYADRVKTAYNNGKTMLRGSYGSDSVAKQLASAAAMIVGGLKTKVFVVTVGGFDTHVTQQTDANNGAHPSLWAKIANAVSQFQYDMEISGNANRVAGLTVSEFGRRPQENGSLGTDHGAASVQFVFGARVNSGVYGQPADLVNLTANGDLAYEIDYRQVYAEFLVDWFGLDLAEAREVLQKDDLVPLDILRAQAGVGDQQTLGSFELSVFPNPAAGVTSLTLNLPRRANVDLRIASTSGALLLPAVSGQLEAGVQTIPIDLRAFPAGAYLCLGTIDNKKVSRVINVVR